MCCLVVLISRPRSMWAVRGGGWYQSAGRPVFRSLIKTSPDIRSAAGGFINCNPTDRLSCDQPGPVAQFYWGNKPDLMGKQTIITTTTTFTPSLTSVHICSSWPDWHIDLQSNHHLLSHSSLLLWEFQVKKNHHQSPQSSWLVDDNHCPLDLLSLNQIFPTSCPQNIFVFPPVDIQNVFKRKRI